jgi:hypothetical protein
MRKNLDIIARGLALKILRALRKAACKQIVES